MATGKDGDVQPRSRRSFSTSALPDGQRQPKPAQLLFAGRIGGNQEFVLDRTDPEYAATIKKTPDAAPYMSVRESFELHGFTDIELWKAAVMEGVGECIERLLLFVPAGL
jgi:hypothetical protein